ncbi:LysM peptidoglycan-binding domain-containing protein [Sinomonas susongensis]|uniref:LysM peptidoglycan-binding domain-containing protein n=1 Tax=Sinomonas susongensis TaxID=1324851 RepID=UPI001FE97A01|nr:LysM peptidoglycan-binding domain-containing protein [Sinomonas susongensis]
MAHAFAVPFGTAPAQRTRLRLTRRGRLVLIALPAFLASVLLLAVLSGLIAPAHAGDSPASVTHTTQVTLQEGQSLWTVASQYAPDRDPRVVIGEIVELNNLDSTKVLPGQQIQVPTAG